MTTRDAARQRAGVQIEAPANLKRKKEEIPSEPFLDKSIRISLSKDKNLIIDEFPDGIEDVPRAKKGEHKLQDWKKAEEICEYLIIKLFRLYTKHYKTEINSLPRLGAFVAVFDYFRQVFAFKI